MPPSMTANWFAVIAIFGWPIVAFFLYRTRTFAAATAATLLGALLLLPSNFAIKLKMVPAFDKVSIPSRCVLIGCAFLAPRDRRAKFGFGITGLLATMYVVGPLLSSVNNGDTLVFGDRILPGVGYYDGISAMISQAIAFLPFFVGRRYFQKPNDTETILRVLVVAGLLYSVPMLFEVRMSPQLSNWIYGYLPSGFSSEARYGGFRPVVFMVNGLATAFFSVTAFLAATAFWRVNKRIDPFPPGGIPAFLSIVIVLCKSAGALTYTLIFGIVVRWLTPKTQLRFSVLLVCVTLIYPILRLTDNVPDDALLTTASFFSQDRADSLQTRFDQEKQLIEYASQRLLLGWGRYGRARVYDENGKDITITDGEWIITLAQFGLVGFIAQFGLLALPVFRAMFAAKFAESLRDRVFLSALAVIVAVSLVEQLPNSSINSWLWLISGALLGRSERLSVTSRQPKRSSLFTRFETMPAKP
jgi:hypothetical protein